MGANGVYFVALGDFPDDMLQDLVRYYRQKYNLEVQVLPSLPEPETARHIWLWSKQAEAEPLVTSLHSAFPEIAWRTNNLHTAVVSSARMRLHYSGEPADGSDPETRIRKRFAFGRAMDCPTGQETSGKSVNATRPMPYP
jgi:hypothetical protein